VLRRLLTTASAGLVCALMAAPAAHGLPAGEIAGVAVHPWQMLSHDSRERTFAGVAATGARWVRVDFPWSWVEEHGPTVRNGHGNWGAIDPIVDSANRHGLKLLPIVGFTPKWASDSDELWTYPDAKPFEDFSRRRCAAIRRSLPGSCGTSRTSSASPSRGPTRPASWSSYAAPAGLATASGRRSS
jgi:hypothetical protein